jgi:putative salt-induced outer membrane protein YdiY
MWRLHYICAVVSLFLTSAFADQVIFKNGDRITGEVVRLENNTLLVKTAALGDVKVKWDAIARLETAKPIHVRADGANVQADRIDRAADADTIITTGDTAFAVPSGHILGLRSDAEQTEYERQLLRQQEPGFLDLWSGGVDAGLSAARGNADTTNINLGLRGARTTANTRLSLMLTSLLARSRASDGSTLTTANAVRSALRYEINVSDRIFTFGFGNFESDRIQHLDLRSVTGGGAGLRVMGSDRGTMDMFTGVSMNREEFSAQSGTPDRSSGELLLGQDASYKVSPRTSIAGRLSFFPNLTLPGEYRASFDTSAVTKLNSWLGWQVTLSNIYVSNPPAGARTNDLLLSTGLHFSLGQERAFKPHSKVLLQ